MTSLTWLRDHVPRPTLRGWAFLVTGVALLVTMNVLQRREFAFVALFVLALPVIGAVGVLLYRLPLTIDRRFTPELAAAGSEVEVRVLVNNHGAFASPHAAWFDDASAPLRASERSPFPRVPRASTSTDTPGTVTLEYTLEARHRGLHVVGPLTLLVSDPFGMVIRSQTIGTADVLTVTPSTVALPRGAIRLAAGSGSAQQSRQLGGGGEQDIISRKYQTGDSMRRVNWSATARFGELMVRQDDQQNDQHAVVILDCAAVGYAADDDEADEGFSPEFEWAVSMSTSIALHLLGEGFQVRLLDAVGAQFDPTTPDDLLLHAARTSVSATADVDFRQELSRSEAVVGDLPPVFAVVGRLSEASLHSLAGAARFSSGAVAIIVTRPNRDGADESASDGSGPGGTGSGTTGSGGGDEAWAIEQRESLEAAGWMTMISTSDDAPSAAWGTVDGERLVL